MPSVNFLGICGPSFRNVSCFCQFCRKYCMTEASFRLNCLMLRMFVRGGNEFVCSFVRFNHLFKLYALVEGDQIPWN